MVMIHGVPSFPQEMVMRRSFVCLGVLFGASAVALCLEAVRSPYRPLELPEQSELSGAASEECDAFVNAACPVCVPHTGCKAGVIFYNICYPGTSGTAGCTGTTHEPCVPRYAAPGCTACTCGNADVPSCPGQTPAGACPAGICVPQLYACTCQC